MFVTSCLLIPYPLVHERYFNLFHLNPPTWSLFWEYIANIVYAVVLYKLRNKVLWVLTILAATALCYEAYQSGNLGVGWGGDNISGGGIRVSYSFLAGMLVYRSGWTIRSRLRFVSMSILLLLAFLFPYADNINQITDPLIILFYLPFLVALGAGAVLTPRLTPVCRFSGEISYPLYMVHYPFIWIYFSFIEQRKPSMTQLEIIIPLAVLLMIALAYMIMVYVDVPIRKYLTLRLRKH